MTKLKRQFWIDLRPNVISIVSKDEYQTLPGYIKSTYMQYLSALDALITHDLGVLGASKFIQRMAILAVELDKHYKDKTPVVFLSYFKKIGDIFAELSAENKKEKYIDFTVAGWDW
jgi:hypothetical protein